MLSPLNSAPHPADVLGFGLLDTPGALLLGVLIAGTCWWLGRRYSPSDESKPLERTYTIDPPSGVTDQRGGAPIGLWIWEPDTDQHWWSSDLYRMIGVPMETDASIAVLSGAVHPSDESALLETLRRARHEDGQGRCEVRFLVQNRQRRLALEFSERPATGEHARRIVGSLQDVTDQVTAVQVERVRAAREQRFEAALLRAVRSEEVLHADPSGAARLLCAMTSRLLECLAVSYWRRDRDSGVLTIVASEPEDPHNLVRWTWTSVRPKERSEILVADTADKPMLGVRVGPGLQRDTSTCLLVPSRASGEQIGTLRLERAGRGGWADDEIRFAEEISNLMAQVVMVAKNRQLELQLRQSQKMESIGQLAGAVAHDFNNLLTTILGYSELLSDGLQEDSPLQDDVREILRSGERAKSLTKHLLAFSRLQPMDQVTVELNGMLQGLKKMVSLVLDEKVQLDIDLQASPSTVRVDLALCEQVILNLVLNARDAMPAGGLLSIRTYLSQPQASAPEQSEVVVAISDTGGGIPSEVRDRIFEPFFTTKPKDKGTGLGLSTAYGIIKQSHGDLRLQSTSPKGSCFEIRLPLHRGPVEVRKQEPTIPAPLRIEGETILVVEDVPSVLKLTVRSLREAGYQVLEAESGIKALEVSADHSGTIDLLVSDVHMPVLSGGETADRLLVKRPDMGVVFMSGFNDDDRVRDAVESHNALYLPKPFTPDQLVDLVSHALSQRKDSLPLRTP